jgi:hypothetical protein
VRATDDVIVSNTYNILPSFNNISLVFEVSHNRAQGTVRIGKIGSIRNGSDVQFIGRRSI